MCFCPTCSSVVRCRMRLHSARLIEAGDLPSLVVADCHRLRDIAPANPDADSYRDSVTAAERIGFSRPYSHRQHRSSSAEIQSSASCFRQRTRRWLILEVSASIPRHLRDGLCC